MPDLSAIQTSFSYVSAKWAEPNFAGHPAVINGRDIAQALQHVYPSFRFGAGGYYVNTQLLYLLPAPGAHVPTDRECLAAAWAQMPAAPPLMIKMATNGATAIGVSPITVFLNNVMLNKSLYPATRYSDLLSKLATPDAGSLSGFKGYAPFTKRMAFMAAFGFTGTDSIANQALTAVPYAIQPFVAGPTSSSILATITSRTALRELRGHMPAAKITLSQMTALMAVRDSFALTGGQLSVRHSRENSLSSSQTFLTGLLTGISAGVVSMPLQRVITKTAQTGSISASVLDIYRSGHIFSGSSTRATIAGIQIGALATTNHLVDWYRRPAAMPPC